MRDYERELRDRIKFIQDVLAAANADGIVYGNSGGKDSALVGILCKKACVNTVGLMMPCGAKRNYNEDRRDAEAVARQFGIEAGCGPDGSRAIMEGFGRDHCADGTALLNMAPRLRMTALYAVAASENRLVAGTGNRSESYMGYYTKWGDGAYDSTPLPT